MLEHNWISLNDKLAWDKALENIPYAPAHTWDYNQAMTRSSQFNIYLYHAKSEAFTAICPLGVREKFEQKDIVTPYGFGGMLIQGEYPNFTSLFNEFLRGQNFVCGYIALHPLFCNPDFFSEESRYTNSQIYVLNLQHSKEKLLQQLAKTHRYELKKWQNSEVKLVYDKKRLKENLPNLYRETLARVSASSVYHFSTETFSLLLNNDNTILIGAEINGEIEAISVFCHTPHIAEYFLNASSNQGRQHTRGLLWAGIESLQELQIPFFNLGGGVRLDDNLDHFKRRFGGKNIPYYVLKQIYNKPIFNQLCNQAKLKQENKEKYFPPYY